MIGEKLEGGEREVEVIDNGCWMKGGGHISGSWSVDVMLSGPPGEQERGVATEVKI